jgi:hypothetical protein
MPKMKDYTLLQLFHSVIIHIYHMANITIISPSIAHALIPSNQHIIELYLFQIVARHLLDDISSWVLSWRPGVSSIEEMPIVYGYRNHTDGFQQRSF